MEHGVAMQLHAPFDFYFFEVFRGERMYPKHNRLMDCKINTAPTNN